MTISVVDELIRNYKRDFFFFVLAEAILTMLCRGKRCVFGVQCKNRKERERRKKKSVSECVRVSDMTARRFRIVNI